MIKKTPRGKFYEQEVIRCGEFIVNQIMKGWPIEIAFTQAIGSYNYSIVESVRRSFTRVLSK